MKWRLFFWEQFGSDRVTVPAMSIIAVTLTRSLPLPVLTSLLPRRCGLLCCKIPLDKLIQFNGDLLQAEMVKAFLASSEYRARFGP